MLFGDEPQEDVLNTDEGVPEETGFLLGQHEDAAGPVRQPFEHSPEPATPIPVGRQRIAETTF